eukprot:gb/GFBE01030097.1/.p1 GENE.gb/GFBE01030097.1/~~gb/GFBE01030097.1/.p1  ORF type:complete len:412 (+),score=70.06 gb/GFBE01030097.1/:1-1236(+)
MASGSKSVEAHSCSLGLRPLHPADKILQQPQQMFEESSFSVILHRRAPSRISVLGRWPCDSWDSEDSVHGFLLKVDLAPGEESSGQWLLTQICEVRPACNGRRSQLIRRFLDDGHLLAQTRSAGSDWDSPHVLSARMQLYMLEMEARAWASCHGFQLIELWRGLRQDLPWALRSCENSVAAYRLGEGQAVAAPCEVWPLFDTAHAMRLSEGLALEHGNLLTEDRATGQGPLQEGNVQVEAFAYMLDRVCRRAEDSADIFRHFVDLGSGRGVAVLTAHALFPFRDCTGVELVPEYNNSARDLAKWYVGEGLADIAECKKAADPSQMFVEGDILRDFDWSDASVVFANSVTWPPGLIRDVARLALRLRRGSVVLTGKRLPNDADILRGFDFRGEACMGDWTSNVVQLWAYQRL